MATTEPRDNRQTSLVYIPLGETIDRDGNEVDLLMVEECRERDNFRMQRRAGQTGRSLRPSPRELKGLYRNGQITFIEGGEEKFRHRLVELNQDPDSDSVSTRPQRKATPRKAPAPAKGAALEDMTVAQLSGLLKDLGGSPYVRSKRKPKTQLIAEIKALRSGVVAADEKKEDASHTDTAPTAEEPAAKEGKPSKDEKDKTTYAAPTPARPAAETATETKPEPKKPTPVTSEGKSKKKGEPAPAAAPKATTETGASRDIIDDLIADRKTIEDDMLDDLLDLSDDGSAPAAPSAHVPRFDAKAEKHAGEPTLNKDEATVVAVEDAEGEPQADDLISDIIGNDLFLTEPEDSPSPTFAGAPDFAAEPDFVAVPEDAAAPEVVAVSAGRERTAPTPVTDIVFDGIDLEFDIADLDQETTDEQQPDDDAADDADAVEASATTPTDEPSEPVQEDVPAAGEEDDAADDADAAIFADGAEDTGDEDDTEAGDTDAPATGVPAFLSNMTTANRVSPKNRRKVARRKSASSDTGDLSPIADKIAFGTDSDEPQPAATRPAPRNVMFAPGVGIDYGNGTGGTIAPGDADAPAFGSDDVLSDDDLLSEALLDDSDDLIAIADDNEAIPVLDDEQEVINLFDDLDSEGVHTTEDLMEAVYPPEEISFEEQPAETDYHGFDFSYDAVSSPADLGFEEQDGTTLYERVNTMPDASDPFDAVWNQTVPVESMPDDVEYDFGQGVAADPFVPTSGFASGSFSGDGTSFGGTDTDGFGGVSAGFDSFASPEDGFVANDFASDGFATDYADEPEADEDAEFIRQHAHAVDEQGDYPAATGVGRGLSEEDRIRIRTTFKRMLIEIGVVAAVAVLGIIFLLVSGVPMFPSLF